MFQTATKLFLRAALSASFLSAVADRFGWWSEKYSAWGNWTSFVNYTAVINPWAPAGLVSVLATVATAAEILFGLFLLVGFRTALVARLSGALLLLFALAMTVSTGIKGPLDYSVFSASAAAFALSLMKEKFLEIDQLTAQRRS
jgi:thiosulfate dehydrogenase [quinone] large subunit